MDVITATMRRSSGTTYSLEVIPLQWGSNIARLTCDNRIVRVFDAADVDEAFAKATEAVMEMERGH